MSAPDPGLRVLDGEMDEVAVHALASGEVAVFSCRSPGREGPNEDSAAVLPFGDGSYVLAVADGLGGGRAGARASALAIAMPQDAIEPIRRMCKWIVEEECDPAVVMPLWRLGAVSAAHANE